MPPIPPNLLQARSGIARSNLTRSNYTIQFALFLTVGGVDLTRALELRSLSIDETTTTQATTATFSLVLLVDAAGTPLIPGVRTATTRPQLFQPVVIAFGAPDNPIFRGQITTLSTQRIGRGRSSAPTAFRYSIKCTGNWHLLNRRVVRKRYLSTPVAAIAADLVAQVPGFTFSFQAAPARNITLTHWFVDSQRVGDALAKLAGSVYLMVRLELDGSTVVMYDTITQVSVLSLTDGTILHDDLRIEEDGGQVRNRIIVRGAQRESPDVTQSLPTNLRQTTLKRFKLLYRPVGLTMGGTVAGETVGYEGVEVNEAGVRYDGGVAPRWIVNYPEGMIRPSPQYAADPAANPGMTVTYRYYLPSLRVVRDDTAIGQQASRDGTDGRWDFVVSDDSLTTPGTACERARAELMQFSDPIVRGSFRTHVDRFRLGDALLIDLPDRGITRRVFIYRRTTKMLANQRFMWVISFTSSNRDFFIDLLQQLFLRTQKDERQLIRDSEELAPGLETGLTRSVTTDPLTLGACPP